MSKPRVLVVDDTAVIRKLISTVVEQDPDLELAGTAPNGKVALMKLNNLNPDIITLDIEMPVLDGISTLREIRRNDKSTPIIMLSSLTEAGAEKTFEALTAGATDYLAKPSQSRNLAESIDELQRLLIPKLKAHVTSAREKTRPSQTPRRAPSSTSRSEGPFEILCIGTSTGGPNALEVLFRSFQQPLPVPIVIVQHMPPVFTRTLAERLDKLSPHKVVEAQDGEPLLDGCAYIAPGGSHMEVKRVADASKIKLHQGPPENSCRPAVDVLFRSVAATYQNAAVGIILTGMGQDGLRGCEDLRERGSRILSQDQASSLIWGMPRAVCEAGLAHETLNLESIPQAIYSRLASHAVSLR